MINHYEWIMNHYWAVEYQRVRIIWRPKGPSKPGISRGLRMAAKGIHQPTMKKLWPLVDLSKYDRGDLMTPKGFEWLWLIIHNFEDVGQQPSQLRMVNNNNMYPCNNILHSISESDIPKWESVTPNDQWTVVPQSSLGFHHPSHFLVVPSLLVGYSRDHSINLFTTYYL